MVKHYIYVLFAACGLMCSSLHAETMNLPNEFFVKERILSWAPTFDIKTEHTIVGTVYRKLLSLTPEYHLKNVDDELVAKAKMRYWSFGATFDVMNNEEVSLGSVHENKNIGNTF